MISSTRNSFGCNILICGKAGFETETSFRKHLIQSTKKSYANIAMVNFAPTTYNHDFLEGTKKLIAFLEEQTEFPILHKMEVPSSMEDYSTILYILDVSKIKKNQEWKRYNKKFFSIDKW